MELFTFKQNKKLRCGYTTGSCAAAAAKAATIMLLRINTVDSVTIATPKGIELTLFIEKIIKGEDSVSCAVRKDSGDDPDVTNGILVYANVSKSKDKGIQIEGGIGVGRVTRPGLECAVGMAAINHVPMMMIESEVKSVCDAYQYDGGIAVEISIPEGVEIAKRTFNPRLGIANGISVLGTSGIVEPMSEQALVDSIKVEMNMLRASNFEYIVVTPGNYGEVFAQQNLSIDITNAVKCSNFVGEVLDYAVELKFKGVLLIGHIGKFVKLAGGIMNTHSRYADSRMEIMTAHAAIAGADITTLNNIMNCITTDEAISELDKAGIRERTVETIIQKIDFQLNARVYHQIEVGAILFSNKYGFIGQTNSAISLAEHLKNFEVQK